MTKDSQRLKLLLRLLRPLGVKSAYEIMFNRLITDVSVGRAYR